MTSPRGLSAVVMVVGLVSGTLADGRPVRQPPRIDGYWLLAADFHVHAFGGDGSLTPWALRREAERRGLDAITVTNHNQTYAARFARWMSGPIVLVGEEITSRNYHLIAAGIERTVNWDQPAADAIEDVHAQGGVAIAAHPIRDYREGYDDRALTLLDGAEAAHPAMHVAGLRPEFEAFFRRAREQNPGLAAIGSSDFHATPSVGLCRTYVLATEPTATGVIDAVRQGRTVASDRDGNLSGDPIYVRMVEAGGVGQRATDEADFSRWFAIACTWIGLLGLVIVGPDRSPFAERSA